MGLSKLPAGEVWRRLSCGMEAGIVGGAAMLALSISESLWDGRVWWEVPNLLGSTFYGPRAFRTGAGLATVSGAALHFVITGTLGGLFGLAFGGVYRRGRLLLLGLLVAIGWYNVANAVLWPVVNPWVPVASPRPATMISHVLLGACLGYMGQRRRTAAPGIAAPQIKELTPTLAPPELALSLDAAAETGSPLPANSHTLHTSEDLARTTEPGAAHDSEFLDRLEGRAGPVRAAGHPAVDGFAESPAPAPSDGLE